MEYTHIMNWLQKEIIDSMIVDQIYHIHMKQFGLMRLVSLINNNNTSSTMQISVETDSELIQQLIISENTFGPIYPNSSIVISSETFQRIEYNPEYKIRYRMGYDITSRKIVSYSLYNFYERLAYE